MAQSYNGWYASPNLPTRPLVVAGESFVPGILDDDDVHTVLQYVAEQMHKRVEPIVRDDWHQADDWGYNYRRTTAASSLSNHSSGTAIDYNSTRHPFGVSASANFSKRQIDEIHKILHEVEVVEWGGDYRNTPDAMHFDIKGTKAETAAAARRIRTGLGKDEDEMKQEDWDRFADIVERKVMSEDHINKVANAVWAKSVSVTKPDGSKTNKSTSSLLRELWQKVSH